MEAENGTHNELPEEPSHEPDNTREEETVSDKPDDGAKVEEAKSAPLENEAGIISQTEQAEAGTAPVEEAETSSVTEEAEASIVSQSTENVSDEELEAAEVTEVVQTTTDDGETAEIEQDATPLSDTQADEQAEAGNVPARQKSRYTPWMQIVAAVVLICVIGGIVFAVRQSTNGHGQTVLGTPTPIPPLTVTKWCTVDTAPLPAQTGTVSLRKVVALSANDAWILGSTYQKTDGTVIVGQGFSLPGQSGSPLLEHWNGKTWSIVPTADTSALAKQLQSKIQQIPGSKSNGQMSNEVSLNDLAVLSDNNIWVVGQISASELVQSTGFPAPAQFMSTVGQPLIEHWDGKSWQIVASPMGNTSAPQSLLDSGNQLTSISAISANDIWAMGTQASKENASLPGGSSGVNLVFLSQAVPLVEHWDGTSWKEQQLPTSLQTQGVDSTTIQALSASDVWSFDEATNFSMAGFTPVPFNPSNLPSGSMPVIVGKQPQSLKPSFSTHILHWDGQNWHEVQFPADLSKVVALNGVTVMSDNNVWAFGAEELNASGTPVASSPLPDDSAQTHVIEVIYHWDGSTWSKANTPGVDGANLTSISIISPDNYWLLGSSSTNQPLLEHWDGKAWSVITPKSPLLGAATQVTIAGQRAWALVSQYPSSAGQSAPQSVLLGAAGTVLETNC